MGGRITVGRFLDDATDSVEVIQGTNPWLVSEVNGLLPVAYDFVAMAYDGGNRLSAVTFKAGGSGGVTVATVAITYVGTSKRIATVTRS